MIVIMNSQDIDNIFLELNINLNLYLSKNNILFGLTFNIFSY